MDVGNAENCLEQFLPRAGPNSGIIFINWLEPILNNILLIKSRPGDPFLRGATKG